MQAGTTLCWLPSRGWQAVCVSAVNEDAPAWAGASVSREAQMDQRLRQALVSSKSVFGPVTLVTQNVRFVPR